MKRIVSMILLSSALLLGACNTVEGLGKDMQNAGRAIEKAGDR